MSLIEMIEEAAGSGALQQIGTRVGMSPDQLHNVIGSLTPVFGPRLTEHAATCGLETVPTGDAAPIPGSDEAEEHGRSILGSIFGSKAISGSIAADASASSGVNVDKIKALLPQLASIAAIAMASRQNGSAGLGGVLGGFLRSGTPG